MALSGTIKASLQALQTGSNDFGGPGFTPAILAQLDLTDGTTANKADRLWVDERTVASNSSDPIDLTGALTDAFGATLAQVELVAIFIINAPRSGAPNTTNLTLGAGSNPVTGYLGGTTPTIGPIRPGAFVLIAGGDAAGIAAVTAGTGDILNVANSSGASATYQIGIVGRSA